MYSLSNYHLTMKKIGSIVDTIINAFKKIVLNDGGTFEDSICLNSKLSQLTNSDISSFSEYSNTVNNNLGMVEPSESASFETDYNKYTNGVQPSLLLISNGRKFDTLYSAIGTNLTFSGDGDKSRINKAGNIEFTKRNLYQYSEDFTNGYWTININGTLASNVAIAPDGTLTADSYTKTSGINTVASIGRSATVYATTGIHTLSVYFKNVNSNTVLLRLDTGNTANVTYNFNTKLLTNTGANILGSSAIDVGNGWVRVTATANITNVNLTTDFANLFPEAAGAQVYVWGAQIELGSVASNYQRTTTSNLTARIDYSTGSSALLLEPARTNLVLNSNNISAATYTLDNITVSGNTIIENTSNNSHSLNTTFQGTYAINTLHTYSFLVKRGVGTRNVRIGVSNGVDGDMTCLLSLTTGITSSLSAVGSWSNISARATLQADGVTYLFEISGQSSVGTIRRISCSIVNVTAGFYVGDGVSSLEVRHIQGETGAFATSRILTTASTVTRTADKYNVAIPTTSNGTCFINVIDNIAQAGGGTHLYGCLSLIGTNNIYLSKLNGGRLRLWTAASNNIYTTTVTNLKLAITFDGTNINVWENGVKVVTNYAYALSNVNLIESSNSIETINSIKTLAFYNSILSNSQCIALTT